MNHQYLNAFINNSATVREKAGANITNARHKAVMYDSDGNVVLATAGDKAFGVVLSDVSSMQEGENLITKAGVDVDVLIKHIGLVEASGAINKGDPITIDATGRATIAESGNFIFGFAFSSVGTAGECVQVQITRSGYKV